MNIQKIDLDAIKIIDTQDEIIDLEQFKINPNDKLIEPIPILSVKERYNNISLMNEGNISLVQGAAKSRKTTLLKSIWEAIIIGENNKLISNYSRNKIAVFDTEQSKYYCQKAVIVIKAMTGVSIDYFKIVGTTNTVKMKIVEKYLEQNPDVGFITLDNIVHFVTDFNNQAEATNIIQWEQGLVDKYNTHICNVLHENSSGESTKAKGHLGTLLVNACDTIIRIEKDKYDKSKSIVSPKEMRGLEFNPFYLEMDMQGKPFLSDIPEDYNKKITRY